MAPAQSTTSNTDNGSPSREDVLLPLAPTAPMELSATDSVAFHLLSDPAVDTSMKYKVTARVIDGAEDIRTLIGWSRDIDKILAGLNLHQDGHFNQAVRVCSSMMRG